MLYDKNISMQHGTKMFRALSNTFTICVKFHSDTYDLTQIRF